MFDRQALPLAQRPAAGGARRARRLLPVLAVLSGAALAYVLPAGAILRRLVAHREELALSTLRVDGSASFFGAAAKEAGAALGAPADRSELQMDSSILMKLPGRCRLELAPLEGSKGAAVVARGKLRQEGNPIPAVNVALSQLCPLLGVRSLAEGEGVAELERHLRAAGVEIGAETSLARFGGEVAYAIGANKPGAPQLWVYKDSFLPARVRFTDEQGVAWDVRFLDYSSPATGEWFPRTVEVGRGQELVLRFTALKGDVRAKLDDKLF